MEQNFEQYHLLFKGEQDASLRPGQTFTLEFDGTPFVERPLNQRLFLSGETALFYLWKSEPDYPLLYRQIDDALDYAHAGRSQLCLNFSASNVDYVKRVYKKLLWKPVLSYLPLYGYTDQWQGGLSVKADGLSVQGDGFMRLVFEVRHHKPGISRHSVNEPPDNYYVIDIPPGTYDWTEVCIPLVIPVEETASVCIFIEGIHYAGSLYIERPFLASSSGRNILPDFAAQAAERQHFNWLGQNLSRKEWPEFEMKLNGQIFFAGEIFERCHRYSESEMDLPQGLIRPGSNTLEFKLISSYREALPYAIHELGLITSRQDAFNIIACPEIAPAGRPFAVLIETRTPRMRLEFDCPSKAVALHSDLYFEAAGLHVIRLEGRKEANDVAFHLSGAGHTEDALIARVLRKPGAEVITGTGDLIYIRQDEADSLHYLKWYLANQIGNFLTVRPTYRWSGTRELNPALWEVLCRLLNDLGMQYVHMMDGRELPGSCANPSLRMLQGEKFLGRQTHERDGAYAYWGFNEFSGQTDLELYYDLWIHMFNHMPEENSTISTQLAPPNQILDGETLTLYRDPRVPGDMEQACDFFISQVCKTRYDATRHTGPSVLFKYFFQAGYSWTGAELMYGPLEPVIAALRGAAGCYGQSKIGGHLAVQWSTSPHDTPERYERYRLALFTAYIQGLTDINTEEGLWHMEEYYAGHSRFSAACKNHLKIQQDFYRYVSAHSRTGNFYTPMAFLHGRCDGWHCFGRNNVWGQPEMRFGKPEESWDLLKLFYPLSVFDAIYRHPCQEGPAGFYTGTPYGNVDIIPVEGSPFQKYKALAFLGYNKAAAEDCDRLLEYVEMGGTLVLGWPHLSTTTNRADIVAGAHQTIQHRLVDRIAGAEDFIPHFVQETVNGETVFVADNIRGESCSVQARTDSGMVLACSRKIGRGTVIFVNARGYPAESALAPVYTAILRDLAGIILEDEIERGLIRCGEDVQYAIYQQDDGSRHLYVLAVDTWYRRDGLARNAVLHLKGYTCPLEVASNMLLKVTIVGEIAAWLTDDVGEIISLEARGNSAHAVVQGYGTSEMMVFWRGRLQRVQLDFSREALQTVALDSI
jgi:hypothetical protein